MKNTDEAATIYKELAAHLRANTIPGPEAIGYDGHAQKWHWEADTAEHLSEALSNTDDEEGFIPLAIKVPPPR